MIRIRKYSFSHSFCLLLFFLSCSGAKKVGVGISAVDTSYYSAADFATIEKFDTHVHLNTHESHYIEGAKADNFALLDIVVDSPFGLPMMELEKIAIQQITAVPGGVFYATTFPVKNYSSDNWQQETIATIKNAVLNGIFQETKI